MRWVAVITTMVFVGACRCGTPPEECGTIEVTFEAPVDGDMVAGTVDVTVHATRDGAAVDLDSASLVTRLSTAAEFSAPRTGTVSGNKVTFTGVTLETGSNVIKVSVQSPGVGGADSCSGSNMITVLVEDNTMGDPDVSSFAFAGDANNDKVINAMEVPPNTDVTAVITTVRSAGCGIRVVDQADSAKTYGTGSVGAGGVAMLPLSFPTFTNPNDLSVNLQAIVTCAGTPPKTNNLQTDIEAKSALRIDRIPPTCGLDAPTKMVLGPNDDPDLKTGFQLRTLATATGALTLEIKVAGTLADGGTVSQTTGAMMPVNDMLSRDFDVPAGGTTSYTVSVEAKDGAGNVCTAMRVVSVDYDPPQVIITSPTDAGSPYNALVIPISAIVIGGEGGTVHFETDLLNRDLGTFTVVNGMVGDAGSFQPGTQTITAHAFDLAGNRADAVPQVITVVQPMNVCSLVFTSPATKPAFITASQLVGGMYNVRALSSCPNTPVTFTVNGMNPLVANTNGSGLATWTVPLTNGNYVFRVEVGSGATLNFDSVDVTVNTTAPNITQPVPGTMPTVLNVAQDTNRAVAGVQRSLTFTATVPSGGRVDVCSNQTPAPSMATACPDGAAGWWVMKTGAVSPENGFTFPDGTYDIKVVVVSGTTTVASNPVSLIVDSIRPTVTMVAFPQEQGTPDKRLNIAELNGMAPRLTFVLGGADTGATVSTTNVAVRDATGAQTYNTAAGVSITGNMVTVTLNQNITTGEADYDWVVSITDGAGNTNVISGATADDPLNTAAILSGYRVDLAAPSCTLLEPSGLLLGRADDADGNMGNGFQLRARASTSIDVTTMRFNLTGGSTAMMTVTPSGGQGQNDFTVAEGTFNVAATCTDASGNATTATPISGVVVDLTPPTCTMTAPTAMAYSSFSITTTVSSDANGRPVTVHSSASGSPIGSLVVSGGMATGMLTYPSGMQTITADVSDLAGNTCTTTGVVITVNAMGCSLTFTAPVVGPAGKVFINKSADTTPATPASADFVATGHSSNCITGQTVRLIDITGAPNTLGMATTNASGDVSISGLLNEGGPYTLRLQIDNGAGLLTNTDLTNVFVDLTPPAVVSVTPSGTNLKFVAAGNPNGATPGYVVDLAAGGDADFNVSATSITGAAGGKFRVIYSGNTLQPLRREVDITSASQDIAGLSADIKHNTTGTFQIEIADEAGNLIRPVDTAAVVDVIPPDAPSVTQMISDPRAATVSLQWNPTYDDGSDSASGAHAGYDIRWSTAAITNGNNLATSTDYFDSTRAFAEALVPHSGSQITRNVSLPPLNTYYIAVRAKDEVGNYSPYTAPVALANPGTMETLQNPTMTASQNFGNVMASNGSVDGDAIDDLVVANTTANSVYVYFGSPTFGSQTTCPAVGAATSTSPCQTIAHPLAAGDPVVSDLLGAELAIGNFGESAAKDLAIGATGFSSSPYFGRTIIVFGGARPLVTSSFVEIRGEVSGAGFGRPFSVPDFTGDGRNELAISAPAENANRGVVYVFRGRDKAGWDALRDGTDTFVKASKADWVIDGPQPPGANGNNFGQLRGVTSLGTFTTGGSVAFTVAASADRVNKLFVVAAQSLVPYDGSAYDGGVTVRNPADSSYQVLSQASLSPGGVSTGFGAGAIGSVNVTGSASFNDLVVSQPRDNRLFVFADGMPVGFGASPTLTINGPAGTSFATAIGAADYNADSAVDLVCTEAGTAPTAWGLFNNMATLETQAGAAFWFSKIYTGASAATPRNLTTVTGNFDGDTKMDIAVGDRLASPGKVFVWH